jgi:hypothetical protein
MEGTMGLFGCVCAERASRQFPFWQYPPRLDASLGLPLTIHRCKIKGGLQWLPLSSRVGF